MVLKPEQERVRTLLVDTITLLCRNGLSYKTEFNINALIGITLDKEDIFLVDIRETVKNAAAAAAEEAASNEKAAAEHSSNSKSRKRRKHSGRGEGETSESEIETETGSSSKKGADKSNTATAAATSRTETPRTVENNTNEQPPSKRLIKQEMFENAQHNEEEEAPQENNSSLLIVKPEPGYRQQQQQRPCDNMVNNALAGPSSWDPGQMAAAASAGGYNPNTTLPMNVQTSTSASTSSLSQGLHPAQHQQVYCPAGLYPPVAACLDAPPPPYLPSAPYHEVTPPPYTPDKKRKSYTNLYKLEVIEFAMQNNKEAAARQFGVDPKTVRDWCKKQDLLRMAPATRKRLDGGGRSALLPALEGSLGDWVKDQWRRDIRVSFSMIQNKAREMFQSGQYTVDNAGPESFSASRGWLENFFQRQGIRTKVGFRGLNMEHLATEGDHNAPMKNEDTDDDDDDEQEVVELTGGGEGGGGGEVVMEGGEQEPSVVCLDDDDDEIEELGAGDQTGVIAEFIDDTTAQSEVSQLLCSPDLLGTPSPSLMSPNPTFTGYPSLSDQEYLRSLGPTALVASFKPAPEGGFACPVCSKVIRSRNGLRPHVNIHLGNYRYNCHHCHKGYSSITSLKEHLVSLHEEEGWKCGMCEHADFDSYRALREHMRATHGTLGGDYG